MLALEGMMNAQRNRGMYLRVGERLAEIRESRKISQAKLAKLLGVVEGTIQNYEHAGTVSSARPSTHRSRPPSVQAAAAAR
jgi:predicted transcriptional regulator